MCTSRRNTSLPGNPGGACGCSETPSLLRGEVVEVGPVQLQSWQVPGAAWWGLRSAQWVAGSCQVGCPQVRVSFGCLCMNHLAAACAKDSAAAVPAWGFHITHSSVEGNIVQP